MKLVSHVLNAPLVKDFATRIFVVSISLFPSSLIVNELTLYHCNRDSRPSLVGDCDDFDKECGKSLTLAMCTAFEDTMAKKCPKMCNLCGKLKMLGTSILDPRVRDGERVQFSNFKPLDVSRGLALMNI